MINFKEELLQYLANLEEHKETISFFHELCSKPTVPAQGFRELTEVGQKFIFDAAESVGFRRGGNAALIKQLALLTGVPLSEALKEFTRISQENEKFPGTVYPDTYEESFWYFTYRQNGHVKMHSGRYDSAMEAKRQMRIFCGVPIPGEENERRCLPLQSSSC